MEEKKLSCQYCGKEFNTVQARCGHMAGCKENPNYKPPKKPVIKIQPKKEVCPLCNMSITSGKPFRKHFETCSTRSEAERKKRYMSSWTQEEKETYIAEGHYCGNCGKLLTEWFGSGQYCSRSCSNSHEHTEEQKKHISEGLDRYTISQGKIPTKMRHQSAKINGTIVVYQIQYCKCCNTQLSDRNKTGYCKTCVKSAPELHEKRVAAGKKGTETKRLNGSVYGWQKRPIISYPESVWKYILEENNIPFEGPNYTVHREDGHCYFLDFYIEKNNIKLDLEIDGIQHTFPDRIERDKIRTLYLEEHGYTVYRIPWNDIKSERGKELLKQKIDNFLLFYSNL